MKRGRAGRNNVRATSGRTSIGRGGSTSRRRAGVKAVAVISPIPRATASARKSQGFICLKKHNEREVPWGRPHARRISRELRSVAVDVVVDVQRGARLVLSHELSALCGAQLGELGGDVPVVGAGVVVDLPHRGGGE